ncbi:MAG: hypothetical protein M3457_15905, partial [Chloroflexota bacterium]|nr:hypothetical protein [Chloroflexota bacterium]
LLQMLNALETLHEANPPLLHRDIKHSNIMISKGTGKPILIDFGAARQVIAGRDLTAILTPGYAPYEQYPADEDESENLIPGPMGSLPPQGPYTDIYALGATCHYALTGTRPPDSVNRKMSGKVYRPLEQRVDGPPEFLRLIDRALAVEPRDRFASARGWREAIEALDRAPLSPPQPPRWPRTPQLPQTSSVSPAKPRTLLWPAYIAGPLAVLVIFLVLERRSGDPPRGPTDMPRPADAPISNAPQPAPQSGVPVFQEPDMDQLSAGFDRAEQHYCEGGLPTLTSEIETCYSELRIAPEYKKLDFCLSMHYTGFQMEVNASGDNVDYLSQEQVSMRSREIAGTLFGKTGDRHRRQVAELHDSLIEDARADRRASGWNELWPEDYCARRR